MKQIYKLAAKFQKDLKIASNYPTPQTVTPIINRAVERAKNKNSYLFDGFKQIDSVNVQNSMDNTTSVYFQLVFEPEKYQQLSDGGGGLKIELINLVKPEVEQALLSAFGAFNFRVKIGIAPI